MQAELDDLVAEIISRQNRVGTVLRLLQETRADIRELEPAA